MAFALPMVIEVPKTCAPKGEKSCYFYDVTEPFGDAYCGLARDTVMYLPKPGEEKPCGLTRIAIAGD